MADSAGAEATGKIYARSSVDIPVPRPIQRHYMNRLGCGFALSTYRHMVAEGGCAEWFKRQLSPAGIEESRTAAELSSWYGGLNASPADKWRMETASFKSAFDFAADLAGYAMMKRVYSTRQILENMVTFWSDHLNVYAHHDTAWVCRKDYDDVIRAHSLGNYADLLVAAALHPAMLLYLDNWRSVKAAPNENQARELLELHTVGRASGYTEAMVKDSAKILSGYTVDAYNTWEGYYDPNRHTTGPVRVLGFTDPNTSSNGNRLAIEYLRYLAHHPATARNIATKLCRHLVADQPSASIVNDVAKAFRDSGTDIKVTLRTLVQHPDFNASAEQLVRNPIEDFVATTRILQVEARRPASETSFARHCIYSPKTPFPFHWPSPEGFPVGDAPWCSPSRMLTSFRMHWDLAGGHWPAADVTYKTPHFWLPQSRIRLDRWVDHLCRVMLGKPADARLLRAVVTATGYPAATVVTRDHQLAGWQFVHVIGTLLDSPDHMRR